jgi:hypothetical protein
MSDFYIVWMPSGGANTQHVAVPVAADEANNRDALMRKVYTLIGDSVAINVPIKNLAMRANYVAYCGRITADKGVNRLATKFLDSNCVATGCLVLLRRNADGRVSALSTEETNLIGI